MLYIVSQSSIKEPAEYYYYLIILIRRVMVRWASFLHCIEGGVGVAHLIHSSCYYSFVTLPLVYDIMIIRPV
jgi:hypothetical protein